MYRKYRVAAVIPAMNEAGAIGKVVTELLALGEHENTRWIDQVIVCDNASTDNTAKIAEQAGAKVVKQAVPGYGRACLTAINALPYCDIVLFVDGDDSCYITQAERLLSGIHAGDDLAIGSRSLGKREAGALTLPQRCGNQLATLLIRTFWGVKVTDLGPFRAIRRRVLDRIQMQDQAFGWTVEMQIKVIQHSFVINEYSIDSKIRIGQSKISGTIRGVIGAAIGILGTIVRMRIHQHRQHILTDKYRSNR